MPDISALVGKVFDKTRKGIMRLYDVFTGNVLSDLELEFRIKLLEEAVKAAPDGSKNLDKFTGFGNPGFSRLGQRPSERLGLIPIKEGLFVESVQSSGDGTVLAPFDLDLHRRSISFRLMTVSGHTKFFTTGVPPEREAPGTTPHIILPKNRRYLAFNSYGMDMLVRSVGVREGSKKQAIVIGPGNRIEKDFVVEAYRNFQEYVLARLEKVFGYLR